MKRAAAEGRWSVSALNLPADVLEQVYRTNARRVLGLSSAEDGLARDHRRAAPAGREVVGGALDRIRGEAREVGA